MPDEAWVHMDTRRRAQQSEPGADALHHRAAQTSTHRSIRQWGDRLRQLRCETTRVLVVAIFFAGPQRAQDVEAYIREMCTAAGIRVEVVALDLVRSISHDLSDHLLFHEVMLWFEEGLVDVIQVAPPCSTWSVLRWLPNGPRPIRLRGLHPWGRPDASRYEKQHLSIANTLMMNSLISCEAVASRGGAYLLEHPADPEDGSDSGRVASIFATEELKGLERRCGACRTELDQCPFGCPAKKATTFSGTVDDMEPAGPKCPGTCQHGRSTGRQPDGSFESARLASYPPLLCEYIAERITKTLKRMMTEGTGPTGWKRTGRAIPRSTYYSCDASEVEGPGFSVINETAVRGNGVVLCEQHCATYTHVDDTAVIVAGPSRADRTTKANKLMHAASDSLESAGFIVKDRQEVGDVEQFVGYVIRESPARIELPPQRALMIRESLYALADDNWVRTDILHTLVGVWIWAALLRRDALSIPQHIFRFLEQFPKQRVAWWKSARRECRAMGAVVPMLFADVGAPLQPLMWATDAQGADSEHIDGDLGGYGIVVSDISEELAVECFKDGASPAYSLVRMDGSFRGSKFPHRPLERRLPLTRLPNEIFEPKRHWAEVDHGRWKWKDHITLGEMRTVVKLVAGIASIPSLHRTKCMSMQDNLATSCAMTKGRSATHGMNHLARRKAAHTMGAGITLLLPWVQSNKQAADELSRRK